MGPIVPPDHPGDAAAAAMGWSMRVMVLGAGGFIGRQIVAELVSGGHRVVGVARSTGGLAEAMPGAAFLALDLASALDPAGWRGRLAGIDVVVNAAGLLRGRQMEAVHVAMPRALAAAAAEAGVRRIVLISAISARPDVDTDYAATKLAGERVLASSAVGWTILRPSLVYGDGSYGGTSLMRGLAGLPMFVPLPGEGDFAFSPIHVRDLARTVRHVCEDDGFAGRTLEPVGPHTLSLKDLLARYRAWLGFGQARFVPVPMTVMRWMGRLGDLAGDGPVSTNALVQMVAGNGGDGAAFARAVGFEPRRLDEALRDRPAEVQDRWHARLYFLAPALKAVLVMMWLVSAWLGLAHGAALTAELVESLGLPAGLADPLRIGSSLLDVAVAAVLVLNRSAARVAVLQAVVVVGYTLVLGFGLPRLLVDPLGPLLKNLPVLLAIAVLGVIGARR
ncbi:SDR family oxidoreductase [Mongoliimonas terrestris]|uniref:SDR family oxidoreductase n=1 Tax=Mongoliimonas terrestris TaxID=1709001 RepID=UPI0009FA6041|nr:SDR family oxidoreductase [Mongoliimonas terrestris]